MYELYCPSDFHEFYIKKLKVNEHNLKIVIFEIFLYSLERKLL